MEANKADVDRAPAPRLDKEPSARGSGVNLSVYIPMALSEYSKGFVNQLVVVCGVLVSLIGLGSVLANLFSWPQPLFLPAGVSYWVSYPLSWALLFLGIGLTLTLQSRFYDQPETPESLRPSFRLNAARWISVGVPGVIGLYYLVQYAVLARQSISIILISGNPALSAAFFSSAYVMLCSLVLLAFWRSNHKHWVSVYVVGIFALFLIALSLFVGFGHILHQPILFNLKMSFLSAAAFIVVGLSMLLGTLPYGGLMLPVVSGAIRIRVFSLLAVIAGLIVLVENIFSIVEINRHMGLRHVLSTSDITLYITLELTSVLTSVAIVTLFLRALTYYNDSMVYAASQRVLAQKEMTIRKVIQSVHSTLDLGETFQKITEELGSQLQADRCFIARFRDGVLQPPTQEYRRSPEVSSMLTMDSEMWSRLNRFSQMVCLLPQPLEFSPESSDQLPEIQKLMREIHLLSGIGCGVSYRDDCKAALFLHQTTDQRVWKQNEKDIMQIVAEQVGLAIYQAELYEALKSSERRFRVLVEGAKEYAVYMLDPHGHIITWNVGTERVTGFTAEDVMGKHLSVLFQPSEMPDWYFDHALEMASAQGNFAEEGTRRRKDGTVFWLRVITSPLYDEAGALIGYSQVMKDITDQKRAQQELWQAKEAAELANRRKSKALTTMSHEFRTSLNAIIGYADMLLLGKATTPERMARYAQNVADSGRYLLTIVNDILDIAQAESGAMRLSPRWIDPGRLLLDLDPMIRPQAEAQGIQLNFEIEPDLPQVFWDPSRIQQAFLNLLSNAVKYNREQGRVTLKLSVNGDRDFLVGQVIDTGLGIPADKLDDVFTEFYRVGGATQAQPGTGLGLTLTRQLVELHGGVIQVESLEGVGSTFTVRLPVQFQPDLLQAVAAPQLDASSPDAYD